MVAKEKGKGRGVSGAHARAGRAIAAVLFVVVLAAVAATSALSVVSTSSPLHPAICEAGACPPPPTSCTGHYTPLSITDVSVKTTATNVTLSWDVSPSEGSGLLQWGNSTLLAFENSSIGSGSSFSVYLNYLEPATEYDYFIEAIPTTTESEYPDCYEAGTYSSTWTTATDSMTTISGYVYGANSTSLAPGGEVEVWCLAHPQYTIGTQVNSHGHYSVNIDFTGVSDGCAGDGWTGGMAAYMLSYGYPNSEWLGHWNETIVVWAPQIVDFYLPLNQISTTPVVTVAEFSHTGFASVGFCKSTSSSVETQAQYTASGSLFGVLTYSVSSTTTRTTSFGSSTCVDAQGEPGFEAWGYPYVSGEIAYNTIDNRTPWIVWTQYYGPLQHPGAGNVTSAPVQDWASEPTEENQTCYSDQFGTYMYGYEIVANTNPFPITFSAGGSVSGASGEQFGASIPVVIDGVNVGSFSGQWGYTLTTDESNDFSATVTIGGPYPTAEYYTISGCSATNIGLVLHVWSSTSYP